MAAKKFMNVYEALEYLENLEDDFRGWLISRWGFHLRGEIGYFSSKRRGW